MLGFKEGDTLTGFNPKDLEKMTTPEKNYLGKLLEVSWGKLTSKDRILKTVMEINPDYKISYLDSAYAKNDMMYVTTEDNVESRSSKISKYIRVKKE
jgi:hypothetical protein